VTKLKLKPKTNLKKKNFDINDLFVTNTNNNINNNNDNNYKIVLTEEDSSGLNVSTYSKRIKGEINYFMKFINNSNTPISNFHIKLNKNYFGFVLNSVSLDLNTLQPGKSAELTLILTPKYELVNDKVDTEIQVALKKLMDPMKLSVFIKIKLILIIYLKKLDN